MDSVHCALATCTQLVHAGYPYVVAAVSVPLRMYVVAAISNITM
jgi:hypothetical protein